MKLGVNDLQALCQVAIKAAKQSGDMIQEHTGCDLAINHKPSGSSRASQIVTEIDLMSQEMILKHIHPTCEAYDLGLLIEESNDDLSRFEKDYFWCIDPLDGTLSFVEQRPGYSVSIALVSRKGRPCLGVVYEPLTQTLYSAVKGLGIFRDETVWDWRPNFDGSYETIYCRGAVLNACWVLEHAPACFVKRPKVQEGGGCLWDYAATACLFEEAGAVVSDSHGNRLDLNSRDSVFMNQTGIFYASHQEIADFR